MATITDLTSEERATLNTFINLVRAWAGEQAKVNNHADAINTMYVGQIQGILALFDTNVTAPNTSGLDGSQGLNIGAELVTIVSHLQGILTGYNTSGHRQMWAKAAGAANLIG